ncbi:hypothetical protein E3P86_01692 [Wallemia ichthyophaga]|uniref:adenosine deaminase n=1 Tax=Wallemia ichthyophaga TaxID=245174 RepID=A0A4T0J7C5_WALIC|nr:hypothetical protein E3P86_01692 [Wallemia ichthyophaga]
MEKLMNKYSERREELLGFENKFKLDYSEQDNIKFHPDYSFAVEFVDRVRRYEWYNLWFKAQHTEVGAPFLDTKNIIAKTKLFQLIKKMPKGGLLHAHTDASVPLGDVFKIAHKYGAFIQIKSTHPLTQHNIHFGLAKISFRPANQDKPPSIDASVMLTESYETGTWCNYNQLAQLAQHPDNNNIIPFIEKQMLITAEESYITHNTMGKIWSKFGSCFGVLSGLIAFEPIWEEYIKRLVLRCVEDGVGYVETRLLLINELSYDVNCNLRLTRRDSILIFLRGVESAKDVLREEGRLDKFYGINIIYCTLRFVSEDELWNAMLTCLDIYKEFPTLIKGFDLVGHEESPSGHTLNDYLETLLRFQQKQIEEFGDIKIPYVFHAGETLHDGSIVDDNLYDALLLGTRRIGHGYSLYKHPTLMQMCKEKGVCVESCPISNEVLRLTGGIGNHPIACLINHGVPVTLSSDDPAIFQNAILSYDFYMLINHSNKTNLGTLKVLARNSIEYSLMDEEDKSRVKGKWEQDWEEYVRWLRRQGEEWK